MNDIALFVLIILVILILIYFYSTEIVCLVEQTKKELDYIISDLYPQNKKEPLFSRMIESSKGKSSKKAGFTDLIVPRFENDIPMKEMNKNNKITLDMTNVKDEEEFYEKYIDPSEKNRSFTEKVRKIPSPSEQVDVDYEEKFKPVVDTRIPQANSGVDNLFGIDEEGADYDNFKLNIMSGASHIKARSSYVNAQALEDVYGPELNAHEFKSTNPL